MNDLVERLRDKSLVLMHFERDSIADTLEAQERRIKSLELLLGRIVVEHLQENYESLDELKSLPIEQTNDGPKLGEEANETN